MKGNGMMGLEIERKFLLDGFPDLPEKSRADVWQGYLCVDPVVRIRSKKTDGRVDYKLCFKGEGTLARKEIELPIEAEIFYQLQELIARPLIHKDYRTYGLPGGYCLECSLVDEGKPTAFYYAEVEFSSVEEAASFQPPNFLGRDVTEEEGYGMAEYWVKTSGNSNGAHGVSSSEIT